MFSTSWISSSLLKYKAYQIILGNFKTLIYHSNLIALNNYMKKKALYKTQTGRMNLNFQIKEFTGTEQFQSELKILDTVTECYTGNVKLIDDLTNAKQFLLSLNCHDALAFDCEGVKLGRGGKITLVQIGAKNDTVYLFDVLKLGKDLFSVGMKEILESPKIYKYMYDCKRDSESLYHEFRVKLTNVLDMQLFEFIVRPTAGKPLATSTKPEHYKAPRVRGLGAAIKAYVKPNQVRKVGFEDLNKFKNAGNDVMNLEPTIWRYRPLSGGMERYAALDIEMIWIISDTLQLYHSLRGITLERLKVASDVYTKMRRDADRKPDDVYIQHPVLVSFVIPDVNKKNRLIPFPTAKTLCHGCRRFFIRSFVQFSFCKDCHEIQRVHAYRQKNNIKLS